MRPSIVAIGLALAAVLAVVVADLVAASFIGIGNGSVEIEPVAGGLDLLPAEPDCEDPDAEADEACARRYAFRPAETLTAWLSVRNEGPLPVTLNGISQAWLDQYGDVTLLAAPFAGPDGGNPELGVEEIDLVPFEPVALDPGDERLVGVEFHTVGDRRFACENWQEGGGLEWDAATISWQWLFTEHEQEIDLPEPIVFMAPTMEDCT